MYAFQLLLLAFAMVSWCICVVQGQTIYNILDYGAQPNDTSDAAANANTIALQQAFAAASTEYHQLKKGVDADYWKEVLHFSSESYESDADMVALHDKSRLFAMPIVLVPADSSFTVSWTQLQNYQGVLFSIQGTLIPSGNQTLWYITVPTSGDFGVLQFENCSDITIEGKIQTTVSGNPVPTSAPDVDGQGYDWWWAVVLGKYDHRPHLFYFQECTNFVVYQVFVRNSPQYHYLTDDCQNFYWKNVTIYVDTNQQQLMQVISQERPEVFENDFASGDSSSVESVSWFDALARLSASEIEALLAIDFSLPIFPLNTDGIDPSANQVLIEDFYIENYDDAIAVKPGNGNGVITDCAVNMMFRNGAVKWSVGLTIGSVPPHPQVNCVQNITFTDIDMNVPFKMIYIKTNPGDVGTGLIDTINYFNISSTTPLWYPIWIGPQQQKQPGNGSDTGCSFLYPLNQTCQTQPRVPINNVNIINVVATGGLTLPGVFLCDPTRPCTNINLNNVTNTGIFLVQKDYVCKNVQGTQSGAVPTLDCLTMKQDDEELAEE